VLPVTLGLLALVYWSASRLWEPMGAAERKRRRSKAG
jgi:hypothetical protein